MPDRNVVIVGCGDVGTRLGRLLARTGRQVFGMRRDAAAVPAPIHAIAGDATERRSYRSLPDAIELAFFTAAATGGEAGYRSVYVDGLRTMLEALEARGAAPARVVFASSTSVYGGTDGGSVDEESPVEPADFRGNVMLDAERVVLDGPFPSVVVRLAGLYGPGRTHLVEGVRSGRIGVSADGESPWTNRIHVEDAARALAHVALLPAPRPVYIAADRESARRDEVVRWLAARLGIEPAVGGAVGGGRGSGKRCSSERLVASGFRFRYPTFRDGYASLDAI